MVKTRVDELVDLLLGTYDSLSWACRHLGFNRNDLTEEEQKTLYENITRCESCGIWIDAAEEEYDVEVGPVCNECYYSYEDEDEK